MVAKPKAKSEAGRPGETEVLFKCCLCEKEKPLPKMRTVTRFIPVLVVCEECARTLR